MQISHQSSKRQEAGRKREGRPMACLSACQVRGHAQTTGEKKEDRRDGSFQGYGKEDKGQLRALIFVTSGRFWTICACLGFLLSHSPALRSFQMTRGPWVPGPEAMPCMLQYRGFWKFRAPGWSFFLHRSLCFNPGNLRRTNQDAEGRSVANSTHIC